MEEKLFIVILLILISAVGFVFSLSKQGVFHKIISGGLVFVFLALSLNHIVFFGIYIFTILGLAVLTTIYSFNVKTISKPERIIISLTGFLLVFRLLFKFTHWPGANLLLALMTIPVLLYIFLILKNGFKLSKEFGFMLVWIVFILTEMYKEYFFNYLGQLLN